MFFVALLLISYSDASKHMIGKTPSQKNEKKIIKDSCYEKPSSNVVDISTYTGSNINNENTIYGCNADTSKSYKTTNCRFLLFNSVFNSVVSSNGAVYLMTYGNSNDFLNQANLITKCQFKNCKASNGGSGGAIYALMMITTGEFQITDTIFENCQGSRGGAIYYMCVKGLIQNCRFVNNVATQEGNDICYIAQTTPKAGETFSILDCQFEESIQGGSKSMISISSNGQKDEYDFHFKGNKITITGTNAKFHVFDSTEDVFNGILEFSGNCMSPSDDKTIIKGPTATKLVIDVENDFGRCIGDLPEPVIPPNQEILDEGKCAKNERCDYKPNEEKEAVYVYVDLSDFTDISKSGVDGGAIHIVNCGLNCNKTTFTRCSAPKKGGGAIYAKNTLDFANSMTFKDLKFKQCSATYGGGLYSYSSSDQCLVTIDSCIFDSNTIVEDSSSPLIGGAAMYLTDL